MLECSPFNPRARSSMAEQWPFKPLVESSNLSALTKKILPCGGFLVAGPRSGDGIRITLRSLRILPCGGFLVAGPRSGDDIRISPRSQKNPPSRRIFGCEPPFGDGIRVSPRSSPNPPLGRVFHSLCTANSVITCMNTLTTLGSKCFPASDRMYFNVSSNDQARR